MGQCYLKFSPWEGKQPFCAPLLLKRPHLVCAQCRSTTAVASYKNSGSHRPFFRQLINQDEGSFSTHKVHKTRLSHTAISNNFSEMFDLPPHVQRYITTPNACQAISAAAVALRFYCKIRFRNGIHADDYLMLPTLLASWFASGVELWGIIKGSGGKEIQGIVEKS